MTTQDEGKQTENYYVVYLKRNMEKRWSIKAASSDSAVEQVVEQEKKNGMLYSNEDFGFLRMKEHVINSSQITAVGT